MRYIFVYEAKFALLLIFFGDIYLSWFLLLLQELTNYKCPSQLGFGPRYPKTLTHTSTMCISKTN